MLLREKAKNIEINARNNIVNSYKSIIKYKKLNQINTNSTSVKLRKW